MHFLGRRANHFDCVHRLGRGLSGDVPDAFFNLLCGLKHFDLCNNPELNRETLAGHLACTLTNLKDRNSIEANGKGLQGALKLASCTRAFPILSSAHRVLRKLITCAGPIPVELLRWKFIDRRAVELKDNAGLELPSNIGELGDSVTAIDLSQHNLRGACCV